MSDELAGLYAASDYPAMSHPASHPAVAGVAAAVAGVCPAPPAAARVLEIGCAAGWNLLPIAAGHPRADCTGIDFSERAIATAREVAAAAGIGNARFVRADLRAWRPEREYDHVIAHGVYSWVEPAARQRLLETCREALAPGGIACVSFNSRAGWRLRRQLVEVARAAARKIGDDPSAPLATLELLERALPEANPHAAHLRWILGDMRAKGRALLPFDDFAPVCDAVSLGEFAAAAAAAGLRLLGEADLAANLPEGIDAAPLAALEDNPWLLQETCDLLGGRAHRETVLCRDDAPASAAVTTEVVLGMSARMKAGVAVRPGGADLLDEAGEALATTTDPFAARFFLTLERARPSCLPVREALAAASGGPRRTAVEAAAAGLLFDSARAGWIELRTEPCRIDARPPAAPALSALRREAVRRRWPLVDAWHRPCTFGEEHYRLLAAFDGTRGHEELAALAAAHCPGLAYRPWFDHLLRRGLFQPEAGAQAAG
jgi:trans-aconitate methyltransferase